MYKFIIQCEQAQDLPKTKNGDIFLKSIFYFVDYFEMSLFHYSSIFLANFFEASVILEYILHGYIVGVAHFHELMLSKLT